MNTTSIPQSESVNASFGGANPDLKVDARIQARLDIYIKVPLARRNARGGGNGRARINRGQKELLSYLEYRCQRRGYCVRSKAILDASADFDKMAEETARKYINRLVAQRLIIEVRDGDRRLLIAHKDAEVRDEVARRFEAKRQAEEAEREAVRRANARESVAQNCAGGENYAGGDAKNFADAEENPADEMENRAGQTAELCTESGKVFPPIQMGIGPELTSESNTESIKEATTESEGGGRFAPPVMLAHDDSGQELSSVHSTIDSVEDNSADQENSDQEGQRAVNNVVARVESELMMDRRAVMGHVQEMRAAGDADAVIAQALGDALDIALGTPEARVKTSRAAIWTGTVRGMASERRGKAQEQARGMAEAERLRRSTLEAAAGGADVDDARRRFGALWDTDKAAHDAIMEAGQKAAQQALGLRWGELGVEQRKNAKRPYILRAFLDWEKDHAESRDS